MDVLADIFCDASWLQGVCESVLFLLCGFDPAQVNETLLETIVQHTPAGTSTYTVLQYAQEIPGKSCLKIAFNDAFTIIWSLDGSGDVLIKSSDQS